MKRMLSYSVVIISLGLTASTALAQATANGPYYATPSWDQQLPASTRFVVLANWIDANFPSGGAAVLDRETGLVWERSPVPDKKNWVDAVENCYFRNIGGRKGWRLPTLTELQSLVDPSQSNPALPSGNPFIGIRFRNDDLVTDFYWTSTSAPAVSGFDLAYGVSFAVGGSLRSSKTISFSNHVWCVRGGEGIDAR